MSSYDRLVIGILLLIKNLKIQFHDFILPRYADDARALGTFENINAYFHFLERHGPGKVNYTKPSKRFLTVHPNNLESGKIFGLHHGFKVCRIVHHLGTYIGDNEYKHDFLKEHTETWVQHICMIKKAGKYHQESYAMVVCAIQ